MVSIFESSKSIFLQFLIRLKKLKIINRRSKLSLFDNDFGHKDDKTGRELALFQTIYIGYEKFSLH